MSKLSFRARALDASKPLPVFRCEDLPDLHEYASINRAVPQMPTGMEKEEESVRVNSPVRPAVRPAPSAARGGGGAADPHKMAAIFSPPPTLGRRPGRSPASPGARSRATEARRSPLEGLPPSSATGTRVPRSSGARKAQRGHVTKPPAAILWSQFLGWALCISGEGSGLGGSGGAASREWAAPAGPSKGR